MHGFFHGVCIKKILLCDLQVNFQLLWIPNITKEDLPGTQSLKMSKGCNNLGPALHGYFMDQQDCSSMLAQWLVAGTKHQSAEVFGEYGGRQCLCICLSFLIEAQSAALILILHTSIVMLISFCKDMLI